MRGEEARGASKQKGHPLNSNFSKQERRAPIERYILSSAYQGGWGGGQYTNQGKQALKRGRVTSVLQPPARTSTKFKKYIENVPV